MVFAAGRRHRLPVWAVLVLGVLPRCDSAGDEPARTELSIVAASSLTDAFSALERGFEARHPNVDVRLDFAGSQVLRLQLEQGAPADVFASANENHMRALVEDHVVERSRTFARNELVIVVPKDNPAAIECFEDLPRARRLVIGAPSVPVGLYAERMLDRAAASLGNDFATRVRRQIVSMESNVRLVRAKVELGEADAAIVYRTDALSSNALDVVPIPRHLNVEASYPIAVVSRSQALALAERFVEFVLSESGQRALVDQGFGAAR